jgi:hypothetical protein
VVKLVASCIPSKNRYCFPVCIDACAAWIRGEVVIVCKGYGALGLMEICMIIPLLIIVADVSGEEPFAMFIRP